MRSSVRFLLPTRLPNSRRCRARRSPSIPATAAADSKRFSADRTTSRGFGPCSFFSRESVLRSFLVCDRQRITIYFGRHLKLFPGLHSAPDARLVSLKLFRGELGVFKRCVFHRQVGCFSFLPPLPGCLHHHTWERWCGC